MSWSARDTHISNDNNRLTFVHEGVQLFGSNACRCRWLLIFFWKADPKTFCATAQRSSNTSAFSPNFSFTTIVKSQHNAHPFSAPTEGLRTYYHRSATTTWIKVPRNSPSPSWSHCGCLVPVGFALGLWGTHLPIEWLNLGAFPFVKGSKTEIAWRGDFSFVAIGYIHDQVLFCCQIICTHWPGVYKTVAHLFHHVCTKALSSWSSWLPGNKVLWYQQKLKDKCQDDYLVNVGSLALNEILSPKALKGNSNQKTLYR